MTTELYNLHTDGDEYRITKFTDGEVESSYLLSEIECQCPAGHHYTCRHRKMLPLMLAAGICNTHWFWDHARSTVVDFEGNEDQLWTDGLPKTEPTQPHSPTVTTADFDSADAGSSPAVAATTRKPWRRF